MKTVIIGLGNPLLSDDGVGIKAVRLLKEELKNREDIDVVELSAGGLRLLDALVGYYRAIIVDATAAGACPPGTIHRPSVLPLAVTRNMTCAHDTSMPAAIKLGAMLGYALPDVIKVWGIEAQDVETFGEELTASVKEALPAVVDEVMRELRDSG